MADALIAAIRMRPLPPPLAALYLTEPIADWGRIDGIMMSGGVGEYVYGREDRDFGDMGRRLGLALRQRLDAGALPWPLLPAGECIRATALGASEYSVQLSGNTSFISNPGALLPRRNLQVLQPPYVCEETIDPDRLAAAIRSHLTNFDIAARARSRSRCAGRAHRRTSGSSRSRRASCAAWPDTIARKEPLFVMLDGDIAQTLGAILREELDVQSEILAIDGVVLWDFDYIDLGRIRLPSMTVPVTIKSLVFSEDPRLPRGQAHLQHHHHHDHGHGHSHDHGTIIRPRPSSPSQVTARRTSEPSKDTIKPRHAEVRAIARLEARRPRWIRNDSGPYILRGPRRRGHLRMTGRERSGAPRDRALDRTADAILDLDAVLFRQHARRIVGRDRHAREQRPVGGAEQRRPVPASPPRRRYP